GLIRHAPHWGYWRDDAPPACPIDHAHALVFPVRRRIKPSMVAPEFMDKIVSLCDRKAPIAARHLAERLGVTCGPAFMHLVYRLCEEGRLKEAPRGLGFWLPPQGGA